jgi:peptide deformylase
MASYDIRIIGDPVLKTRVREVEEIDGSVARLVDDMLETMYAAPGIGLAANQIGVQKRLFVWDIGDGPRSMVNPDIIETDGEWEFEEGCLSVPGLSWPILRPKRVHVVGLDLDGNEVSVEADELEARMFQHELDHLDGILLVERLDDETRKAAMRTLRELRLGETRTEASGGLRLP